MNIQRAIDRLIVLLQAENQLLFSLEHGLAFAHTVEQIAVTRALIGSCKGRIEQLNLVLDDLR